MLEWIFANGKWYGYDDDTLMYRVLLDPEGWTWEDVPEWEGMSGYNTADEAKLAAEADYAQKQAIWEAAEAAADEEGVIDLDFILEAFLEDRATEAMERLKGLID